MFFKKWSFLASKNKIECWMYRITTNKSTFMVNTFIYKFWRPSNGHCCIFFNTNYSFCFWSCSFTSVSSFHTNLSSQQILKPKRFADNALARQPTTLLTITPTLMTSTLIKPISLGSVIKFLEWYHTINEEFIAPMQNDIEFSPFNNQDEFGWL